MLGLSTCRTSAPASQMSTSGRDWSVSQGQLLWQANRRQQPIAADFLLATNRSGNFTLTLSKNPFPLASAGYLAGHWWIHYGTSRFSRHGFGHPPARFDLFQITAALEGHPLRPPWVFSRKDRFHWNLQNSATGENIQGVNLP